MNTTHARRRSLADRYRILRVRRRAYEQERDRAAQAAEHDRFADMIRTIRQIDREIAAIVKRL